MNVSLLNHLSILYPAVRAIYLVNSQPDDQLASYLPCARGDDLKAHINRSGSHRRIFNQQPSLQFHRTITFFVAILYYQPDDVLYW